MKIMNNNDNQISNFIPGTGNFEWDGLYTLLENRRRSTNATINTSLLLFKFPSWFKEISKRGKWESVSLLNNYNKKLNLKKDHLNNIIRLCQKPPDNYDNLKARHFPKYDEGFDMVSQTRLLIGLSGGSVFETSLNLHPLYGFPFIPGSSLKGLARHYCEEMMRDQINPDRIDSIFGTVTVGDDNGSEGNVIFYDSWPAAWPLEGGALSSILTLDVMTPLYKDYYRTANSKLPRDNQQPQPILFLAVKENVTFHFYLAPSACCNNLTDVDLAIDILREALTNYGVGAKTDSSYGYFTKGEN